MAGRNLSAHCGIDFCKESVGALLSLQAYQGSSSAFNLQVEILLMSFGFTCTCRVESRGDSFPVLPQFFPSACAALPYWFMHRQFPMSLDPLPFEWFLQAASTKRRGDKSECCFVCFAGRGEGEKPFFGWVPKSALKAGRLRSEFCVWVLRCVTQATFLESLLLSVLIWQMGMMTAFCRTGLLDQVSVYHICCI